MAHHNKLGEWGESVAAELLVSKGYAIVERNWRTPAFEIDIIASKGSRIVFVEVKTRKAGSYDPLEAITKSKISQMVRAANAYLRNTDIPFEAQFDVIAITGEQHDYRIEHFEDAFYPPARFYR